MKRGARLVYGIGLNDADYPVKPIVNGEQVTCAYYMVWKDMLRRCYSNPFKINRPTYDNASVCKDWHSFSEFRCWVKEQEVLNNFVLGVDKLQLDKDILFEGNMIYSPDTCVFVSRGVNSLFTNCRKTKTTLPFGVDFDKISGKYRAYCNDGSGNQIVLGRYLCQMQAHKAWQIYKASVIESCAEMQTDARVKCALLDRASKLRKDASNNALTQCL